MKMTEKDKRNYSRLNSLNLISYYVYNQDDTMINQGMGRTLNISASGILLEIHISIEKEQIVTLDIGLEEDIVNVRGKAIYSKKGKDNMFETGIAFINIDDYQKKILDRFIEDFENQKQ